MSHGLAWSWPHLLDITSIEDGASYLKVRTKKRSPHIIHRCALPVSDMQRHPDEVWAFNEVG
ncbi:hypothetical protein ACC679_38575, partial [Rhizobium ruizarguesonis]